MGIMAASETTQNICVPSELQQRQNKQRQRAADPGERPAETDPGGANGGGIGERR